jgi:hypothetical protein
MPILDEFQAVRSAQEEALVVRLEANRMQLNQQTASNGR